MSDSSYPGDPAVDYSTAPDPTPAQAVASEVLSTDGAAPPPLKPGWQTTEFWLTLIGAGIGVLVGLGFVGPDFAKNHEQLVNAVALLASILAPGMYAVGRSIVKHGHQKAVAQVLTATARDGGEASAALLAAIFIVLAAAILGVAVNHLFFFLLLLLIVAFFL